MPATLKDVNDMLMTATTTGDANATLTAMSAILSYIAVDKEMLEQLKTERPHLALACRRFAELEMKDESVALMYERLDIAISILSSAEFLHYVVRNLPMELVMHFVLYSRRLNSGSFDFCKFELPGKPREIFK